MSVFDLLVLGDANPDLVLRGGQVVPAFGQAERIVEEAYLTIGGSGAIMACGAARLGLSVAFCGVVGDDLFGRFLREAMTARGVDLQGLVTEATRPTGVTVVLSSPQDRAMLTAPGTIADLRGDLVPRNLLASVRHVHVSSYYLQRALAPDLPGLFDDARAAGASTSVDPNWDPSGAWDGGLIGLLPKLDVFLPNAVEATSLARTSDLDLAVQRLRAQTPVVVVKDGDNGALGSALGTSVRIPPFPSPVVDTTGAGDSFDAGFLAAWLDGVELERALAFGNVCGALSTRGAGGTDHQPTMEEALEALEGGSAA
jgi:sugar/nucleoside kinase (ribokinase family)